MRPFILVQGPVATRSGYGNHTRDLVISLMRADKYDIKIIIVENNYNDQKVNKLLTSKGYKKTHKLTIDDVYEKIEKDSINNGN